MTFEQLTFEQLMFGDLIFLDRLYGARRAASSLPEALRGSNEPSEHVPAHNNEPGCAHANAVAVRAHVCSAVRMQSTADRQHMPSRLIAHK